jgi:hypothetical protein
MSTSIQDKDEWKVGPNRIRNVLEAGVVPKDNMGTLMTGRLYMIAIL